VAAGHTEYGGEIIAKDLVGGEILPGQKVDKQCFFTLPMKLDPSLSSRLHGISYFIKLTAAIPWSPNVSFDLPLKVYYPSLPPSIDMYSEPYNAPKNLQLTKALSSTLHPVMFQKVTTMEPISYPSC